MAIDLKLFKTIHNAVGRITTFRIEPGPFGDRVVLEFVTDGGTKVRDVMRPSASPRSKHFIFVSSVMKALEYVGLGPEHIPEVCFAFSLHHEGTNEDGQPRFSWWRVDEVIDPPYVDECDIRIAQIASAYGDVAATSEAISGLIAISNDPDKDRLLEHIASFQNGNYAYRLVAIRLADLIERDGQEMIRWRTK